MLFRRILSLGLLILICAGCVRIRQIPEAAPALAAEESTSESAPLNPAASHEMLPGILADLMDTEPETAGCSLRYAAIASRLLGWAEKEPRVDEMVEEAVSVLNMEEQKCLREAAHRLLLFSVSVSDRHLRGFMLDAGCLRPGQPGDREKLGQLLMKVMDSMAAEYSMDFEKMNIFRRSPLKARSKSAMMNGHKKQTAYY